MTDTKGRIAYALKKKNQDGVASPDKRGKKIPGNKLSLACRENIKTFLDKFPKYKSPDKDTEKIYLSPELTFTKLYEKYKEETRNKTVCLKSFKSICKEYNVFLSTC